MKYKDALQKIDTLKALEFLGREGNHQGAYVKFSCDCGAEASVRILGEKKNLWYCPGCKSGGNILSLTMRLKNLEYEDAKKRLLKLSPVARRITKELTLEYELKYTKEVEALGLTEEFCAIHQIGVPKGKTMLAGCLTFLVKDEAGMKVAYYGIRIKNRNPVFHKSFNPELYLYGMNLSRQGTVTVVSDMAECVKMLQEGTPAICNFGLPYLSPTQISMLNQLEKVDLKIIPTMAVAIATQLTTYYRFI